MTAPQRGKKSLPFILPSFGAVVVVVGVVVFEIDPTFVCGVGGLPYMCAGTFIHFTSVYGLHLRDLNGTRQVVLNVCKK